MKFSILLQHITPHRSVLATAMLLLVASAAISLVQPLLAGEVTRALVSDTGNTLSVKPVLFIWLALMVVRTVLSVWSQYHLGSANEHMTASLRVRLFLHLQSLPLSHHYQRRSGETLSLLSYDAQYVSSFVIDTLIPLLPMLLTFVGALIMVVLIDPLVAVGALVLMPTFFMAVKIAGRKLRPLSRAWMDAYGEFIVFLNEALAMRPAIKTFVREPTEAREFYARNNEMLQLSKRKLMVQAMLLPVTGLIIGLGLLLFIWVGSERVASGTLSAAEVVSLLLYLLLLSQPLRGLANTYGKVQMTLGSAQRLLAFLGEHPEPDDFGKPTLPEALGDIHFEDVKFTYPGGMEVLAGLNFHIRAGQTVAITGPNGAGKSTIAHLLLRLAELDAGTIFIDGVDINTVTRASVRSQVGLVSQHTLLINGTVRANIAYGVPLVDARRIEEAARAAQAHEFIEQLPQGYDTVIGDQGLRLSGGQRQRLSLARTLLTDPPILILDEATSMFDPAAEEAFLAQRRAQMGQKTVILITHRPGSIALAQQIIDLNTPPKNTIVAQYG